MAIIDFEKVTDDVWARLLPEHVELKAGTALKDVSYPEFLGIMMHKAGREAAEYDIIPPENMVYMSRGVDSGFVAIYIPEQIRDLRYATSRGSSEFTTFRCPLPNIVVEFKLTKSSNSWSIISGPYFYMTKVPRYQTGIWYKEGMRLSEQRGSHRNQFCTLSLPNIYDGGSICMGNNTVSTSMPEHDFSQIDRFISVLLDQPFSSDLSIRSVRGDNTDPLAWMRQLKDKAAFPYNLTSIGDV